MSERSVSDEYEDVASVAASAVAGSGVGSRFALAEESVACVGVAGVAVSVAGLVGKFVVTVALRVDSASAFVGAALPKSVGGSLAALEEIAATGDSTLEFAGALGMLIARRFGTLASPVEDEVVGDAEELFGASDGALLEEIAASSGSTLGLAGIVGTVSANMFGTFASAVGTEIVGATKGMFDAGDGALLACRPCEIGDLAEAEFPALGNIAFDEDEAETVGAGQTTVGAGKVVIFAIVGLGFDPNS